MDLISQFLLPLGVTVSTILLLIKLFGDKIGEHLLLKTKSKYDKELEEHRNALSNIHGLFDSTVTTISAGFATSQERRLKAIQVLWDNILSIRESVSSYVFFYDILLPSEYEDSYSSIPDKMIPETTQDDFSRNSASKTTNIEKHRPFLGERLWFYFFIFRAFSYRIELKFIEGRDKKQIYSWKKGFDGEPDRFLDVLNQVLTEEQLDQALKARTGSPRMVMNFIEQKILVEMNDIISGTSAAQFSLSEGLKLAETLRQAESMMSNEK